MVCRGPLSRTVTWDLVLPSSGRFVLNSALQGMHVSTALRLPSLYCWFRLMIQKAQPTGKHLQIGKRPGYILCQSSPKT